MLDYELKKQLNIFLLTNNHTPLADEHSEILENIASYAISNNLINFDCTMDEADAIVIEEKYSFKNFRYIRQLKTDPIFKQYADKIFTINKDTHATGLIKGLYYSLPKKRFNPEKFAIVPYFTSYNELILTEKAEITPYYSACWMGNTRSNVIRKKIVMLYENDRDFNIKTTTSWYDHSIDEKKRYIDYLQNAKFSLCPAGWVPNSHRIYESMALRRCPVIIADQYVPPSGPEWESLALFISEKKLSSIKKILDSRQADFEKLGENAYRAWEKFFSPQSVCKYYVNQLINIIEISKPSSVKAEFKRWDSFQMYYYNNWTIPQRIINKVRISMSYYR